MTSVIIFFTKADSHSRGPFLKWPVTFRARRQILKSVLAKLPAHKPVHYAGFFN